MKITKRELKNYEILQLFNEFVKNLNTEGLNPKYSLMLYKNIEALTIPYNNIIRSVYNEANDTEYQKYQHDLNDTIVKYADRDEQGNVPKVPVSDFKNDRRRNYRSANNINYLDGDWASSIDLDGDSWQRKNNEKATVNMYDKSEYPRGSYSLVADNARVVKGGSWKDIHYYASPGNRRYLDQDESTAYIGFRCAMTRLGSQNARR